MTIIRHTRDLEGLPHDRRVNGLLRRDKVRFDIPDLARHRQIQFQSILNRYQSRCGCVAATVCFLSALTGGLMWALGTFDSMLSWHFGRALGLIGIGSVIAATVGKLTALEVTRVQFSRACRAIQRELRGA